MGTPHRRRRTAATLSVCRAVARLAGVVALLAGPAVSLAAVLSLPTASPEYALKAAFLYNFARFVEWPIGAPGATGPQVAICVLGADPFGETLDQTVAGKAIGERSFRVARIRDVSEAAGCAVVFVSAAEAPRLGGVLEALHRMLVLTVGDADGFAEAGGIIGMVVENNKVRLEVNLAAADEAHIRISSKLLSLARIVGNNPSGRR